MKIPSFIASKVVDENGAFTPVWREIFTNLFTQMRVSLSDEGFLIPSQPTDNIAQLGGMFKVGTLLYDSDTNELKVNINGTYKIVQTN